MIAIKYRLVEGMDGAGTHTERELATGPRNLVKIAGELDGVIERLKAAYGNVGCGRVWVEVEGLEIDSYELRKLRKDDYQSDLADYKAGITSSKPDSVTFRACEMLADIKSGSYK